ncbi:MAG: multidrug ABC transporter [Clostridia bacterium]|nr:multidrug ABC transporter [Clostridia bacterium]
MNKYYILMISAVIISSFSQILLKKSTKQHYDSFITEYLNPFVILGYTMMIVSTLLIIAAYRGLDYKNGPIIESLGFILVMILSYLFFDERISQRKLLGYILILLGVIIFYI